RRAGAGRDVRVRSGRQRPMSLRLVDGHRARLRPTRGPSKICHRQDLALDLRGVAVITVVQAAEIAQLLWERDPLAFLGLCASCKEHGMTLLERIQQRAKELK